MNILIITPYSHPSKCGIWNRALIDAEMLKEQGHNVTFFSSNIEKGTSNKLPPEDNYKDFKIYRFSVLLNLGGTAMLFLFFRKLRKLNPDLIFVHGYRHPHTLQGLIFGKLMRKKVYLATHGPFEKDPRRSIVMKIIDILYDVLVGWWELRLYNKIIVVARWEIPYLKRRNAPVKKLHVVPNAINNKYIDSKPSDHTKPKRKILFMGRIEKVKRVEWILDIAKKMSEIEFTILGPVQDTSLTSDLPENVRLINKGYNEQEFIDQSKDHDIFLFPSIRESFGFVGLEAMSQGLILISSNTKGVTEYLVDGKNGFIVNSAEKMIQKIKWVYDNWEITDEIRDDARMTAERFSMDVVKERFLSVVD
jgi:glycosyltransferase involved in cell wall biosynthesis